MVAPPQLNSKASAAATSSPLTPPTPSSADGFYRISESRDQVATISFVEDGEQSRGRMKRGDFI